MCLFVGWHFLNDTKIVYNGGVVSYSKMETAYEASGCGGVGCMILWDGVDIYINKGTMYSSNICC